MSVPPFPSQDLAKLVLGYLAEEQLMTAYDEFLQASPYLDALRNEYDRIFMTSLRSILAEYRAVKIYVDTCKPFVLRKKIFQCPNLLEVVKFLVSNVDINKIQLQDATDKANLEKQKMTIPTKANICELCHSLTLPNCVCKSRQPEVPQSQSISASYVEASSLQTSVETTPLADLPGNHNTKKKPVKTLEKDSVMLVSNTSSAQNSDVNTKQSFSIHISPEEYLARCENSPAMKSSDGSHLSLNSTVQAVDPCKSNQNIEEFNKVLKSVVNRNKTIPGSECSPNQRMSNISTFHDFASGVTSGESQNPSYNVPDSSTSENLNVRVPIRKDVCNGNVIGPSQLMLQVSHINDNIEIKTCREDMSKHLKLSKSTKVPKIQPNEKKIKIISDIQVSNQYNELKSDNVKKVLLHKNATSTPLLQMQTIMINGTPAYNYKHTPKTRPYTEDEIMAMPTLIVVPASGSTQLSTSACCEPIMTQSSSVVSQESSSPRVLGPLVIDVPPPNTAISNNPTVTDLPDLGAQKPIDSGLIKTVDVTKNIVATTTASVPKDNVTSIENKTPQVLPPTRKSSSTPRRSSHVRVLDFTTPRRILHETINEQVPSQSSDPPAEIILSGSSNVVNKETPETIEINTEVIVVASEEKINIDGGSSKENESRNKTIIPPKKYDWDADLRALVANEKPGTVSHRKPKSKNPKKKKTTDKVANDEATDTKSGIKKRSRSKKSPKLKTTKTNVEKFDGEPPPNLDTTNVGTSESNAKITSSKNCEDTVCQGSKDDIESIKNKSHEKDEEYVDTPEAERLSLQNVIGAKLNISDLLETPYKQALYDIQMGTPRFLGPDLPDEPLSDIKIMNIPTPRFLNTPKPVEATPSSYSSRPTDYSSGGSYYKPDDQDFMPVPDLMICPVTSSKEDVSSERSEEKESDEKKSRPVRQCTRNVSYYRHSSAINKTKDLEDNDETASLGSDTISINSSFEFKEKKGSTFPKTPLNNPQSLSKTENKKKSNKNRKSPKDSSIKDKTKSFMKIKPRCTPKKDPSVRNRKKVIHSPYSKASPSLQQRKRTSSKEKIVNVTPLVVPLQTKSRRKSSTPRKLHCTKTFNPENYDHVSPESIPNNPLVNREKTDTQDSDTEQLALRWSDDGSQDNKAKDPNKTTASANEIEDINKIQQFIDSSNGNNQVSRNVTTMQVNSTNSNIRTNDGNLQQDLMKRGFDLETAKIIERDLLDDTSLDAELSKARTLPMSVEIVENKKEDCLLEKSAETESNITNELQIVQDETDNDEIELSVHECNEESTNYFVFEHDETKEISQEPPIKLKDNFTMEICIEDVTVRLRPSPFYMTKLDQDPVTVDEIDYSYKETEQAVNSISNIDRLYTPLKDSIKAQCYEIFDSTLTSIDTPLKANSPSKASKASVSELVLEKETEAKTKADAKKRKRVRSGSNEPANVTKRSRQDADLLLKTANIQNIDIETVLTKLHGH